MVHWEEKNKRCLEEGASKYKKNLWFIWETTDSESQANILLDKRPRGESKVSGGVFQGAPAGSQYQHQVEAGKD